MAKIKNYCETCGRVLATYRRSVTVGANQFLQNLANLHQTYPQRAFFHYREIITQKSGGTDYGILQSFGLIQCNEKESGYWAITELGEKFIHGEASIPRHLIFYLSKVIKESPERIFIHELSKEKFNLKEVMQTGSKIEDPCEIN